MMSEITLLLILELSMTVGGIWTAVTGKPPTYLFGNQYRVIQCTKIRLLGIWLALVIPIAYVGDIILIRQWGELGAGYISLWEMVSVAVVAGIALIAFTALRQPIDQ